MRPADINRARKALEHIKAAQTLLNSIKWENIGAQESAVRSSVLNHIIQTKWTAEDLIRIGGGEV